jgi:hypothetical protein
MGPKLPVLEQRAGQLDFFRDLPMVDRAKSTSPTSRARSSSSRCSSLRRLRRLRRDALRQADHPALRRPHADRQRHRLLVDLRRQPAHHPYAPTDGRGPAWSNSLFEDNAEFGLGMRLAVDKQTELAASCWRSWPAMGDDLAHAILDAAQTRPRPASPRSASGSRR